MRSTILPLRLCQYLQIFIIFMWDSHPMCLVMLCCQAFVLGETLEVAYIFHSHIMKIVTSVTLRHSIFLQKKW